MKIFLQKTILGSLLLSVIYLIISAFISVGFILAFQIETTEQIYTFPNFYFILISYFIAWFFTGLSSKLFEYPYFTLLGCIVINFTLDCFLSDRSFGLSVISFVVYIISAYIGLSVTKKLNLK